MNLLNENPRLKEVARYAEEHIQASAAQVELEIPHAGPAYRWQHTLRVTQYGVKIAEAEGANLEWVTAACLLHDSEWFSEMRNKEIDHGWVAARAIRTFLEQIDYPAEAVDNICYSVAVHSAGSVWYEHEHTLEAKVVSDADNIDRFGALRTIFWCVDELGDFDALVAKLSKRIKRLEDYRERQIMETATGNQLFNQQLVRQIEFFKRLIAEHQLTRLP
jgi:uncharacterized protein